MTNSTKNKKTKSSGCNVVITMAFLPVCLVAFYLVSGCRKYPGLQELSSPAYLRVFNSISSETSTTTAGAQNNFLTFIMDPEMSPDGAPTGKGYIVQDYLATRRYYTVSYAADAAATEARGGINYAYPDRDRVPVAPVINGLDLSAWAQMTSGKHRILFVGRPFTSVPFADLSKDSRKNIIIDTVIDFAAGEVYTLEALLNNADIKAYTAYIRNEPFTKTNFAKDSIYISFYNLSTPKPKLADNFLTFYSEWVDTNPLKAEIRGFFYDYSNETYVSTNPASPILNILEPHRLGQNSGFYSLIFSKREYYFDPQNNLGIYTNGSIFNNELGARGSLPYFLLNLKRYDGKTREITFNAPNANFNNLIISEQLQTYRSYLPQLSFITRGNNDVQIYPTINIVEVVNEKIYLMQIKRGMENLPGEN